MSEVSKPRVFTVFEKLSSDIQEQIKLEYPFGFSEHLISFYNKDGERVSALRFETGDKIYLIKMSASIAEKIVSEDDDYDDDGVLKSDVKEDYEDKHQSLDDLEEDIPDESSDD